MNITQNLIVGLGDNFLIVQGNSNLRYFFRAELTETLTSMIFTASVQHQADNASQFTCSIVMNIIIIIINCLDQHQHHQAVNAPQFTYTFQPHRPLTLTRFSIYWKILNSWINLCSLKAKCYIPGGCQMKTKIFQTRHGLLMQLLKLLRKTPKYGFVIKSPKRLATTFRLTNRSNSFLDRESTSWRTSCPLQCRVSAIFLPWTPSRTKLTYPS